MTRGWAGRALPQRTTAYTAARKEECRWFSWEASFFRGNADGHPCSGGFQPRIEFCFQSPSRGRVRRREVLRFADVGGKVAEFERLVVVVADQLEIALANRAAEAVAGVKGVIGIVEINRAAFEWAGLFQCSGMRLSPSSTCPGCGLSPATSSRVWCASIMITGTEQVEPAFTMPGQRTIHGTRMPAS